MKARFKPFNGIVEYAIQKLYSVVIVMTLIIAVTGCSKSDDTSLDGPITTGKLSISVDGVNNCLGGTIITLKVPYTFSQPIKIKKLKLKTTLSNGTVNNYTDTTFQDNGSDIEFMECIVFDNITWQDYEVQLESEDGKISNITKGRLNKPTGAN
tara:strand:+ start:11180 stop:11641 length:462 start_codon:yes stop_codon:yes gene_type:complete